MTESIFSKSLFRITEIHLLSIETKTIDALRNEY